MSLSCGHSVAASDVRPLACVCRQSRAEQSRASKQEPACQVTFDSHPPSVKPTPSSSLAHLRLPARQPRPQPSTSRSSHRAVQAARSNAARERMTGRFQRFQESRLAVRGSDHPPVGQNMPVSRSVSWEGSAPSLPVAAGGAVISDLRPPLGPHAHGLASDPLSPPQPRCHRRHF